MRRWASTLWRVTATAAVVLLLPFMAGPAQAAPTTVNQRTQDLTAMPVSGMPMASVSREIRLAGGTYGWWTFPTTPGERCENYTGPILAGTYSWTDQLWPGSPSAGTYRHEAFLTEVQGGWTYHITCYFRVPVTGSYTWGSGLDPHF